MPKDPKNNAELSYESLSACLRSASSAEGAIACQTYFNKSAPNMKNSAPNMKNGNNADPYSK